VALVFACIAPHGDVDLAPELREAMEELGRRCAAAQPEVAVVVTPHSVHVDGHFAVVTAARVGAWETDRETAHRLARAKLPILRVSYGGNDPGAAEFPADWGTEVPLSFLVPEKIVVVSPARELRMEEHVRLGEAIAALPGRVALVASADHGHTHSADGPYGFDSAASFYDGLLQEILGSGRLDFTPLSLGVDRAKADSLWQLLVLQGAVGEKTKVDVLAYAAPTYYGMLVAEVATQTAA
jgi:aromatic ring-opening dioxygenase LigB subunit